MSADENFNVTANEVNQRATSASPAAFGYNPCSGGSNVSGICTGGNGLLSPENITLFSQLGPGAVTDNMFGILAVTQVPGSTDSRCATGSPGGTPGDTHTNQGGQIIIGINVSLWAGLNCGDRHFDPKTQGQDVPEGNDFDDFSVELSCSDLRESAVPCLDPNDPLRGRVSLDITNNFSWANGGAVRKIHQDLRQVTNLGNEGETKNQDFRTEACVSSRALANSLSECESVGSFSFASSPPPTVFWRQTITDPDFNGAGSGFTQDISGRFVYNGDFLGLGAVEFGCGLGQQGCSPYPGGVSQTIRSIDPRTSVKDNLP